MIKVYTITKGEVLKLTMTDQYEEDDYYYNPGYGAWLLNKYFNIFNLGFEQLYCLAIDNSNSILGIMLISSGNLKETPMHENLLAFFVLAMQAERFAIFHNHPSDVLEGSAIDSASFMEIKELAKHLEIEFEDSYVIAQGKCIGVSSGKIYDTEDFEE